MFAISFANAPLEYPYDDPNATAAYGELRFGDAPPEGFLSDLAVWDKCDYQQHWRRELEALLAGQRKITLIVNLPDLLFAGNAEVWNAYLNAPYVYFQNQILWGDNLPTGSDPSQVSQRTPERRTTTEDGQGISEWTVTLEAILRFLHRGDNPEST